MTPSSGRGSTQAAGRVVDREGRALLAPSSPGERAEAEQQVVGPREELVSFQGRLLHLPRALRHLAPRRGQIYLSLAAGVLRGPVVRRDVRRGRHVRQRPEPDGRAEGTIQASARGGRGPSGGAREASEEKTRVESRAKAGRGRPSNARGVPGRRRLRRGGHNPGPIREGRVPHKHVAASVQ